MSVPRAPALVPTSPNPGAISIFAPPKTGSTFLSAFLAALAAAVCHNPLPCAHSLRFLVARGVCTTSHDFSHIAVNL